MITRTFAFGWLAVTLVCSGTYAQVGAAESNAPEKPVWMIDAHALELIRAEPGGAQLVETFFDNPRTFVMAGAAQIAGILPHALPVVTFASYAAMSSAFASGQIDPRYRAVIYDSEDWSFTPKSEQVDPARFYRLAAQLVHAHGLIFIATPATDLWRAIAPTTGGSKYDAFVRLRVPAEAASQADYYEIQAQGAETDSALFTSFTSTAAEQAKSANPNVIVLVGLSTNPTGHRVTGQQLFDVVSKVMGSVSGFWLNIPGESAYCPTCGKPQPQVAVELLKQMAASSNSSPAPY